MYIPKNMTKQIAKVFYDKEVSILVKTTTIDAEGGVNTKGYDVIDTFKLFNMPVSFNQLEADDIIETSKHDKKMEAGKVKFILLDRIGNAYIDRSVSDDEMRRAIEYVKNEESN